MTALVLSNTSRINSSNDFDARLAILQMPRISRLAVLWHQIKSVVTANPGLWLVIHLWFWGVSTVTGRLMNILETEVDDSDDSFDGFINFLAVVGIIILSTIVGAIAYVQIGELWPLILTLPLAVCAITIVLAGALPAAGLSRALQFWQYVPAKWYFTRDVPLPPHIRKRYEELRANGQQEMDLYVLEFAEDPFLVAVEKGVRPWFLRRKVIVGAWDTGTKLDQI